MLYFLLRVIKLYTFEILNALLILDVKCRDQNDIGIHIAIENHK